MKIILEIPGVVRPTKNMDVVENAGKNTKESSQIYGRTKQTKVDRVGRR